MVGHIDYVFGSAERDLVLPLGFAILFPTARALLNKLVYEVGDSAYTNCVLPGLFFSAEPAPMPVAEGRR
jgi:hypothetical protein